jgi:hypothetical protein
MKMSNRITLDDQKGKALRRCDDRCLFAKGKRCTCICGGARHGIGNRELRPEELDALNEHLHEVCMENVEAYGFTWRSGVRQLELPWEDPRDDET